MEIRRAFRERLYPNKEQEQRLLWTLDQCRMLYNAAVEQRRHALASYLTGRHLYPMPPKKEGRTPRRTPRPVTPAQQKRRERAKAKGTQIEDGLRWRVGLTYEDQCHDLVELKVAFPEFKDVNSQILQNVCKRVDLAWAAYLDRKEEYRKRCKSRAANGATGSGGPVPSRAESSRSGEHRVCKRVDMEKPPAPPHFKGKRYYSSFTQSSPFQGWKLEHGGRGPFPVRCPDELRIPRSTARRHLKREYGKLVLSNIGAITVRWSRPIEGTVKTVTVRREGPEWYVTFSCVLEVEQHAQPQRPADALDVGLEHYATFTDDSHIDNPRYYRANEETLARRQRIVSAKVEAHRAETKAGAGSSLAAEPLRSKNEKLNGARRTKNLARVQAQVAKTHRKAQRRREYFHHKQAKELIVRVGAIGVEALSIDNMVRRPKPKLAAEATGSDGAASVGAESPHRGASAPSPSAGALASAPTSRERRQDHPIYAPNGASAKSGLNKSINDAAWGTWLFILQYKAEAAGVLFVKVDPKGTSQVCSRCRKNVPKSLSERWHLCPHCGLSMPRDQNSACEIYQRAGFGIPPALATDRPVGPSPGSASVAAR